MTCQVLHAEYEALFLLLAFIIANFAQYVE